MREGNVAVTYRLQPTASSLLCRTGSPSRRSGAGFPLGWVSPWRVIVGVASGLLLAVAFVGCTEDPEGPSRYGFWVLETVDTEAGYLRAYTSLALDVSGYPYISYSGGGLKCAYRDASGWHIETVDASGGEYTSLALDRFGQPHISHCGGLPDGDLRYAYRDGSGWHTETVDAALGSSAGHTSLSLDGSGDAHISYFGGYPGYDLRYACRDGSGWRTETVDTQGNVGRHTSLALDGSGYVHISYFGGPGNDLKYAYRDASGWHTETVDAEGVVGLYTSLVLDAWGYPHISYFDDTNDGLKYASRDGLGWRTETVDSEGEVGPSTSLALDSSGYPHISYCKSDYEGQCDDLKYAYRDASGWHIETVDAEGYVGGDTSLALDGSDCPRISYYHQGHMDVKYAWLANIKTAGGQRPWDAEGSRATHRMGSDGRL